MHACAVCIRTNIAKHLQRQYVRSTSYAPLKTRSFFPKPVRRESLTGGCTAWQRCFDDAMSLGSYLRGNAACASEAGGPEASRKQKKCALCTFTRSTSAHNHTETACEVKKRFAEFLRLAGEECTGLWCILHCLQSILSSIIAAPKISTGQPRISPREIRNHLFFSRPGQISIRPGPGHDV